MNKIARFEFTKIQQYEMIKIYFNYLDLIPTIILARKLRMESIL
jgi:hypothetical protein